MVQNRVNNIKILDFTLFVCIYICIYIQYIEYRIYTILWDEFRLTLTSVNLIPGTEKKAS